MTEAGSLAQRRIALAETRELDLLAQMLEREGAAVVRCPLVTITDTGDSAGVTAWLRRLVAGEFHDVIFYTGEGVRRLAGFAERAGLKDAYTTALGKVRKFTRGPKPVKALRELGLSPDVPAEAPTTAGLIATLGKENLRGRTVGVQIYGQEPNTELLDFLKESGATPCIVAPYVYASKADDERVGALITEMAEGRVDALVFTSSPQIERLTEVAAAHDREAALKQGLSRTRIAAIGPVVADTLERHGITVNAMPDGSYNMKPLVRALARLFHSGAPQS
jgi:uroporphyrinogen-III synthase